MVMKTFSKNNVDYFIFSGFSLKQGNRCHCQITSKTLTRLYNKFKEIRVLPIISNGYLLVKPSEEGSRLYNSGGSIKFATKIVLPLGKTKIIVRPEEFNLKLVDFGFLSRKEIHKILSKKPKLWILGHLLSHKKGMCLTLSADGKMKGEYVAVLRDNDKIILKKIKPNSILKRQIVGIFRKVSHKSHNNIIISVSSLVPKSLVNKNIWVGLYPKEWDDKLDIGEPFTYIEEKELAKELYENGFSLFSTHSYGFDIGIVNENCDLVSIIEVRNEKSGASNRDSMFRAKGSVITAKIQTARIWSMKNKKKSFVILSSELKRYNWLNKLIREARKDNCIILFSNFGEGWSKEVANKIKTHLNI